MTHHTDQNWMASSDQIGRMHSSSLLREYSLFWTVPFILPSNQTPQKSGRLSPIQTHPLNYQTHLKRIKETGRTTMCLIIIFFTKLSFDILFWLDEIKFLVILMQISCVFYGRRKWQWIKCRWIKKDAGIGKKKEKRNNKTHWKIIEILKKNRGARGYCIEIEWLIKNYIH